MIETKRYVWGTLSPQRKATCNKGGYMVLVRKFLLVTLICLALSVPPVAASDMQPGKGYWIKVSEDCVWVVD